MYELFLGMMVHVELGDRDTFKVGYLDGGRSDIPNFSGKVYVQNLLTQISSFDRVSEVCVWSVQY